MTRSAWLAVLALASCSSDPGFVGEVPTNPDALLPWLKDGRYEAWDREATIHPTDGPHLTHVRTYFNVSLAGSLESDNPEHVVRSAAVKELYEAGFVRGWAVMVKTEAGTSGDTWYWYEVLDRDEPRQRFEGQGLQSCVGCHASGVDHVRTSWP